MAAQRQTHRDCDDRCFHQPRARRSMSNHLLGALATERPRHLNARLGFRELALARALARELPAK